MCWLCFPVDKLYEYVVHAFGITVNPLVVNGICGLNNIEKTFFYEKDHSIDEILGESWGSLFYGALQSFSFFVENNIVISRDKATFSEHVSVDFVSFCLTESDFVSQIDVLTWMLSANDVFSMQEVEGDGLSKS